MIKIGTVSVRGKEKSFFFTFYGAFLYLKFECNDGYGQNDTFLSSVCFY
jgi:hypothetical protein